MLLSVHGPVIYLMGRRMCAFLRFAPGSSRVAFGFRHDLEFGRNADPCGRDFLGHLAGRASHDAAIHLNDETAEPFGLGASEHGAQGAAGGIWNDRLPTVDVIYDLINHVVPDKDIYVGDEAVHDGVMLGDEPRPRGGDSHLDDPHKKEDHSGFVIWL